MVPKIKALRDREKEAVALRKAGGADNLLRAQEIFEEILHEAVGYTQLDPTKQEVYEGTLLCISLYKELVIVGRKRKLRADLISYYESRVKVVSEELRKAGRDPRQ